jgi:hypothetical protein
MREISSHKKEIHLCYSLLIFAVTNMLGAKVDKTVREKLVWHGIG